MGIAEIEPPPQGTLFDMPLWLLIPLALVWAVWVWRMPRNHDAVGWFIPPTVITVAAFILVAGLSHGA